MRNPSKMAAKLSFAALLASLVAVSAFADSRRPPETWRDNPTQLQNRDRRYRENERVTFEGRVTSIRQERDGYRVQLDRNAEYQFWVPQSHYRQYGQLRSGVFVSFGGYYRAGTIWVDQIRDGYRNDRYYRGARVYGVVEDIDYRHEVIRLRDRETGRRIKVDADRLDRYSRVDLSDLRRGDLVELAGDWGRGHEFEAYRIESVQSRRW